MRFCQYCGTETTERQCANCGEPTEELREAWPGCPVLLGFAAAAASALLTFAIYFTL